MSTQSKLEYFIKILTPPVTDHDPDTIARLRAAGYGDVPFVPARPRPLVGVFGADWETHPDAGLMKRAFNKVLRVRSTALKAHRAHMMTVAER